MKTKLLYNLFINYMPSLSTLFISLSLLEAYHDFYTAQVTYTYLFLFSCHIWFKNQKKAKAKESEVYTYLPSTILV